MDHRARTQELRFSFTGNKALSGASGRIHWQEAVGKVPVKYVVSRNGELGVMQAVDGKAQFVAIPDAIEGQAAPVDLAPDSLIITEGQHSVVSGDSISLSNP
ncbi:MAG: hypothetical protein OQK12_05055 [Motiliproteus sp.]|nr:hypothetical protein [Motiliproteus sp.]MCW9052946.1 hypothetical protein [Motiliproteus sp.]